MNRLWLLWQYGQDDEENNRRHPNGKYCAVYAKLSRKVRQRYSDAAAYDDEGPGVFSHGSDRKLPLQIQCPLEQPLPRRLSTPSP